MVFDKLVSGFSSDAEKALKDIVEDAKEMSCDS